EQNVIMLGHIQDVDALLAATDILVFPSHLNGPGRSVFEAGARGIPAIVAFADRVEDIVEHAVTGLIVPERDPQALAEAIMRISDDPALRARLGANARRKYVAQFDPKRIGEQMLKVYESVVAENREKGHR
ncbi:MAG: glycosyltransferase, partial [bacterium]